MKKALLFATAALFFAGTTFASISADKGKKKKCAKGKTCCTKSEGKTASCSKISKDASATKACCKDKAKATTVSM